MDELTELQHDSSIAEATAPPDFRAMFQSVVSESGLATSEDVTALRDEINALSKRLVAVEQTVAELPKVYASADSVSKVRASQAEYETSRRKMSGQLGEILNFQVDITRKYTSIETSLNELSTLSARVGNMATALETFTENIGLFTSTQRERGDHHEARIANIERRTNELAGDVTFLQKDQDDTKIRYTQVITPMHDFINGSPTQKPLKDTLEHFETTLNTLNAGQAQRDVVLKSLDDHVKAEKAKEEARRTYWRTIRLNWYTPRGIAIGVLAIIVILMVLNSFSFDQLIARIQQLAVLVELFRGK